MTAIEKYYDRIMSTQIDLYELAGREKESVEGGLNFLASLVISKKFQKDVKKRLNLRRKVIDDLIIETGGVTNLKHINLRKLANPNDDKITGILTSIISKASENFVSNPSNEQAVREINKDKQFTKNKNYYDGRICCYITDCINKKEGVLTD